VNDPSYFDTVQLLRDAKKQSVLLEHITNRWTHEYLTSLREFYHISGRGGQQIKYGDIMLVHDDCA